MSPSTAAPIILLTLLWIAVTYTDVRYRRIPNKIVLVTLISGLLLNAIFGGLHGLLLSLGGFALAFALMFVLHVFGAMGAGDVKLFAAIGSVVGVSLVLPTYLVVALTGGVLAVCKMLYARSTRKTLFGVLQFFVGMLPGWQMPRFDAAASDRRHTIPYGVAITFGSLLSLLIFRA